LLAGAGSEIKGRSGSIGGALDAAGLANICVKAPGPELAGGAEGAKDGGAGAGVKGADAGVNGGGADSLGAGLSLSP
jgi:hypothetical protein